MPPDDSSKIITIVTMSSGTRSGAMGNATSVVESVDIIDIDGKIAVK